VTGLSVIIAGGGVGGLTLAGMLTRQGAQVTVLEKSPARLGQGAALAIWPNAMLGLLASGDAEMYEEVLALGRPVYYALMGSLERRWYGRVDLRPLNKRYGVTGLGMVRTELMSTLVKLSGADIRYGHEVVGATSDGTVTLSSGETLRADVVVGADGIGSAVRRALLPPGSVDRLGEPHTGWQGVADQTDIWDGAGPEFMFGNGGAAGLLPLNGGRTYWFVDGSIETRPETQGWPEIMNRMIAATPPEQLAKDRVYTRAPVRNWGSGRITLLGDAAHPLLPTVGQGACMAIESAAVLAARLRDTTDPVAALRQYESDRFKRVTTVFKRSITQVRQRAIPDAVRNRMLATMPDKAITFFFTGSAKPIPEFADAHLPGRRVGGRA
jgi:2-polyprenyl-6-methoxyphenol hydroxylase-like FAD-dependent oxidoreductase